jgi:hypothetical protein
MKSPGKPLLCSIAALTLSVLATGAASAASTPNAVYTLDAPLPFAILGATGTVTPYLPGIEGALGPLYTTDVICLDGGCSDPNDFSNQDWMVFRVTVLTGSLDQVTIGALFEASNGLGYFTSLGGSAPTSGDATTNANSPEWLFSSLTGSSVPLIAVYDAGDLPSAGGGPFAPGSTNFDLRLGGSADQFLGIVTTPIPEPSTGLLLGLAMLGLARWPRRA